MAYTRKNWVDGVTPLNATNMNNLEAGVAAAHQSLEGKLGVSELSSAVAAALAQAKAGGEFDGADGITPHIGANDNWFIGETDTGLPSRGAAGTGKDGFSPVVTVTKAGKLTTIKITTAQGDVYARVSDGQDADKAELSAYIATELAKRGQLKPEVANSIEDCTDTSKLYVLPDGYIYAYMYTERPAYTNLADPASSDWLPNKRFSSGNIVDFAGNPDVIITNPIIPCKPGDTIRMRGVNIQTQISSSKPRTYFYNGTSVVTDVAQQDYYAWDVISNGYGTWDNATKTATFRLVNPTTGSAIAWSFDNIRQNLRLASGYSANDVIITVNQEISDETIKEYAWANTGHAFVPADYEGRIVNLEKTEADHESRLKLLEANEGDGGVPSYWLDELSAKADTIQRAMEAAGRNKSAFLWYTDAHWPNNAKASPMLLDYLIRHTPMNKVNFGGDIVGDPASFSHENIKYVYEWRKAIAGLPNHHSVPGNHDLNHNSTDVRDMSYAFLLACEESADKVCGAGLYYYIDNPSEKTRYIHLDYITGNHDAMVAQGQFIVDALKSASDGWHIVMIAHRWFQYTSTSAPTVGSVPNYESDILSVLDAYNARATRAESNYFSAHDFTSAKGKVEFCIGGHIHVDYDFTSSGGIPIIVTASDTNQERSGDETEDSGTVGTVTESAVYGIIADYTNNKITVVGVGRGGSRVINEQPKVLISLDRTFESGTSGEDASITLNNNNSKAFLNVAYDTGKFAAKSCAVSGVTENGITVTEPGTGGVCVAYPAYVPDLATQAYKLSFDYAATGSYKTRAYWRGIYPDTQGWGPVNTIVNSGSGESGHIDFTIPADSLYETIVIFFGSNTGGTATFSNVSLTKV